MTSASTFTALHFGPRPFLLPNAWDMASALLLADAGFAAIGTTSLGVTAAAGLLDGAGAGRELTSALARRLVLALPVPLTVDLEGGYSEDPAAVAELAAELAGLGVAGINLEDGRADRDLRASQAHAAIIGAVVAGAPGLFVNARTDTYWLGVGPEGERLPETIRRLRTYRDVGASGVFVPGLTDFAHIEQVVNNVALPLNVLCRPDGDLDGLAAAGVARVSTGSALYRFAVAGALHAANAYRDGQQPALAPIDYDQVQAILSRNPDDPASGDR